MISIFGGTGFVGGNFFSAYSSECEKVERDSRFPLSKKILYFISTVDNYNIKKDSHVDVDTNLKILLEVLDNCRDNDYEFNFISSWFVYGNARLPAREIDHCDPKGFYSITKRCAEQLLISFCETFGVKYRILRLCNVYGEGDGKVSAKKNAIQYMIGKLKNNEDIDLYEGGYILRDLMHVSDVCRAIKLVISEGDCGEIYNIGSGNPVSVREIMEIAQTSLKSLSSLNTVPTPSFHKQFQCRDFYLDVQKLKNLGFKQQISLKEGIQELCNR